MAVRNKEADPRIVLLLRETVNEDFAKVSMRDWAQRLQLSGSRFEHLFKEATGITPSRYVTAVRLQRARHLLETTNLPMKEIISASGINDRRLFNRLFRRRFGKSPPKCARKISAEKTST